MNTLLKEKFYDYALVISSILISAWIFVSLIEGETMFFMTFFFFILPSILLYLYALVNTLNEFVLTQKMRKLQLLSHLIVFFSLFSVTIYQSELFKADILFNAVLKDDFNCHSLTFREDGTVENKIKGINGEHEIVKGQYKIENNHIIFSIIPDNRNFIPDTVLWDQVKKALFIEKDYEGEFITQKGKHNHFKIIP